MCLLVTPSAALQTALLCVCFAVSATSLGCIGSSGDDTNWFVSLKVPESFAYTLSDADTVSSGDFAKLRAGLLTDEASPVTATLAPLFQSLANGTVSASSSLSFVAYNDEFPDSYGPAPSGGAHAKGVIATDGTSGFWLVHSQPKSPADSWVSASGKYGQHYFCMTISAAAADTIAKQYIIAQAHVFASSLAAGAPHSFTALVNKQWVDTSDSVVTFNNGVANEFFSLAKSPSWGKDLYEDLVEPQFSVSAGFAWETWRRSPFLPSYCNPTYAFPAMNMLAMKIGGVTFSYTQDHAKWGMSLDSSKPFVCLGDINRMQSQRGRGGGTACFSNASLFKALSVTLATRDSCPTFRQQNATAEHHGRHTNGAAGRSGDGERREGANFHGALQMSHGPRQI